MQSDAKSVDRAIESGARHPLQLTELSKTDDLASCADQLCFTLSEWAHAGDCGNLAAAVIDADNADADNASSVNCCQPVSTGACRYRCMHLQKLAHVTHHRSSAEPTWATDLVTDVYPRT